MTNRPLRVFLCHSSTDKPAVRELYQKLRAEPWIQPWLDEEELFPGMDWNLEIEKAIEATDVILVCLSNNSITKEGYVQREIRIALDYADYKPEGTLFIIPVRLEECTPPKRLARWQYADYFEGQRDRRFQRLLGSLKKKADSLGLKFEHSVVKEIKLNPGAIEYGSDRFSKTLNEVLQVEIPATKKLTLSQGMEFMCVSAGYFSMGTRKSKDLVDILLSLPLKMFPFSNLGEEHMVNMPYDYWMARFPVTNELYFDYVKANGIGQVNLIKPAHPVTKISWNDAVLFCKWLNDLYKDELPLGLELRLPTEAEWEKAARGTDGRKYPWGDNFDIGKCNSKESGLGTTTPVSHYSPSGDSPYGCADMVGNVYEWTHSLFMHYPYKPGDGRENEDLSLSRVIRGGSFLHTHDYASCDIRSYYDKDGEHIGFRVCLAPPIPK